MFFFFFFFFTPDVTIALFENLRPMKEMNILLRTVKCEFNLGRPTNTTYVVSLLVVNNASFHSGIFKMY